MVQNNKDPFGYIDDMFLETDLHKSRVAYGIALSIRISEDFKRDR